MKVSFVIPGDPHGKGRPRFATIGGHARTYTDAKTASYESLVAISASTAVDALDVGGPMGVAFPEGPLLLEVAARFTRPKKYTDRYKDGRLKNGAENGEMLHDSRPDLDNIVKSVMDGINQSGRVWSDDSQVCTIIAKKRYVAIGGAPYVSVTVKQ